MDDYDLTTESDDYDATMTEDEREWEQLVMDVRHLLSDEAGMRFFSWFFDTCNAFEPHWVCSSEIYKLEGRREVALVVLDLVVDAQPEKLTELLLRTDNERRQNRLERERRLAEKRQKGK